MDSTNMKQTHLLREYSMVDKLLFYNVAYFLNHTGIKIFL